MSQNLQNKAKPNGMLGRHPTGLPPKSGPVGRFSPNKKQVLTVLLVL
jgi:hypothetical protein